MNLSSYFQMEVQEIRRKEGVNEDHYGQLFQSQNESQKLTKKQIADKLAEYEFLMSQIDAQEDPMALWEEYLEFLLVHQDRSTKEGNQMIFTELEKFTRYSCERDYIKSDLRCARFWIEYSDMCKDKEDVIYHMEENEIGLESAYFYEEICKITESKMDYPQADKYILEGKFKQAQPVADMCEAIKQFEQRMEERIHNLRDLANVQMMHDSQSSDSKKRKRVDFDLVQGSYRDSGKLVRRKTQDKNNKMVQDKLYPLYNQGSNNKKPTNGYYGANKLKTKKKKLPERVYIGDGLNIYVDEEYREEVFPHSTILVTEYSNLVEEVKGYLSTQNQELVQSQRSVSQQQPFQMSQKNFLSQQFMNSAQLGEKNKSELMNALSEDIFFPKKPFFEVDLETSWIGREEKKYKSFEVMDSQKNSQNIVSFNMCDFMFKNSDFKIHSPQQLGFCFTVPKNENKNAQRGIENNFTSSLTPLRSPQKQSEAAAQGIVKCDSIFGSQSPYRLSNKYDRSNNFNNPRNKRPQGRALQNQEASPLQWSGRRMSHHFQSSEESSNHQKMEEQQSSQYNQQSCYQYTQNSQQYDDYCSNSNNNQINSLQQRRRSSRLSNSISKGKGKELSQSSKVMFRQEKSPMSSEKQINRDDDCNKFQFDNVRKINLFSSENSRNMIEDSKSLFNFSKDCSVNNKSTNTHNTHTQGTSDFYQDDYIYRETDWGIENSCLNKAFHNDYSRESEENEDMFSLDYYSDQYSFLQNKKTSKDSKLSECVRSRKSSKLEKLDIFANQNSSTKNSEAMNSPHHEKSPIQSKRRGQVRKSIEKLRNNNYRQPPPVITIQNLQNQSFQSIQFSQEFSQVTPIYNQEGFFSPSSIDDNLFKIYPPQIDNNSKIKKQRKLKKGNATTNTEMNYTTESEKSLTEQEDEEINDMLNKYCFNNENKCFGIHNQTNNSNSIQDSLQEKENLNLIVNKRRSKQQISQPRKALIQLPIEEFTEEAILDQPILPPSLVNDNFSLLNAMNEDIHESPSDGVTNNQKENQMIYYSHNQFKNSRNTNSNKQNSSYNYQQGENSNNKFLPQDESNHFDKQVNHNYEYILTKSMCHEEDHDNVDNNEFEFHKTKGWNSNNLYHNQQTNNFDFENSNHYFNHSINHQRQKDNLPAQNFSNDIFQEDSQIHLFQEEKNLKNNKKFQKLKKI